MERTSGERSPAGVTGAWFALCLALSGGLVLSAHAQVTGMVTPPHASVATLCLAPPGAPEGEEA